MRVCLASAVDANFNLRALQSWQCALNLWQIGWTTCPIQDAADLDPAATPLLVLEGFGPSAELDWSALSTFVQRGGHLLLTGLPGLSDAHAQATFSELTGVESVEAAPEQLGWPALMATAALERLAPWRRGEVLFFTTPAFDELARERCCRIAALSDPSPEVLATVYWTLALPRPDSEEFAGCPSNDVGLVAHRPYAGGGTVIYTPLPLGSVQHILPPQVVEVDAHPRTVENHGMWLLLRALALYMLGRDGQVVPELALWPRGATGVLCLTGDVHEFDRSPTGNARREFQYIRRMANLVSREGFHGKFTFYVTGRLAENHAEVLRQYDDWDFGGHTYSDTAYVDTAASTIEEQPSGPEFPELTSGRQAQRADVAKTLSALARAVPQRADWRRNWRTHYYSSTALTREILTEQGVRWLSDMGTYWPGEWQPQRFGASLITYVSYPQRARGAQGQVLPLWEMGEVTPSDYALWVSGERHPHLPWASVLSEAEAARLWCERLDRAQRAEELCVINWHPFHSLQSSERIEALTRVMGHARRLPGLTVMTISEVGTWWDQRSQVRMSVISSHTAALHLRLHNQGEKAIDGVTIRLFAPSGTQLRRVRTSPPTALREIALPDPPTGALQTALCLSLPPRVQIELSASFDRWAKGRNGQ